MGVTGKIYTYPGNFRAYKALIAAQYSGQTIEIAKDFVFGKTNNSGEFLEKFTTNNVPAFETADGKFLNEANAIAFYLANQELRGGSDLYKQSQVQQWINFADNEIVPVSCGWVFPLLGITPQKTNNPAKKDCLSILKNLDKKLLHSTFFVGERITLADIAVFCSLLHLYSYVLDPNERNKFVNLNRWFNTILNQKQVQAVIENFALCQKSLESEKKQEPQTKTKEQKPPKSASKKKAVEEHDDDDDIDMIPAEPKPKEIFDPNIKPTFILDDFKRCYSNEEETVSIPYFWDKFDYDNFSIWFSEYKYNDELGKVFMSCNLITGMFQRLDKMRKYSFASVMLFGEDSNSTISGVWVWRGQDLLFTLSPDWQIDYDCYNWTKLDPRSEDTKKIVHQYFSHIGTDSKGRKFNQGKIFK